MLEHRKIILEDIGYLTKHLLFQQSLAQSTQKQKQQKMSSGRHYTNAKMQKK